MSSKHPSTRGKSYTDLRSLKKATLAWCEAEFLRLAGYAWNAHDAAALRDDTDDSPARDVWGAIERAIVDARAWLAEHADVDVDDGCADRVRRAVEAMPHVTEIEAWTWTRRKAIVLDYDAPERWWWRERKPTDRELAIVSLLAGEWPDGVRLRMKDQALTVAEVVAAEARAIRQARKANQTLR